MSPEDSEGVCPEGTDGERVERTSILDEKRKYRAQY